MATRTDAQALAIMADAIYTWLEANASAWNVGFETLPQSSPALMQQSETVDPVLKEYKSGRKVYRYAFALYLRLDNADTASRLNNQRELQAIADALCGVGSLANFRLWGIHQDTTPRILSTEEGMDVVQILMHADYE